MMSKGLFLLETCVIKYCELLIECKRCRAY